jgi:large subunit ribosomal protein L17
MRHQRKAKNFGRKFNARKALWRGLVTSLVEHGRICTTVEKAKELRRHVEPMITLGKKGDIATRRVLMSRVPNDATVAKIVDDISVRFKTRAGGYTRIIKVGQRPGDTAEMAFIEFVDFDYKTKMADAAPSVDKKASKAKAKKASADAPKTTPTAEKMKTKLVKKNLILVANKKKHIRKSKAADRAANRN